MSFTRAETTSIQLRNIARPSSQHHPGSDDVEGSSTAAHVASLEAQGDKDPLKIKGLIQTDEAIQQLRERKGQGHSKRRNKKLAAFYEAQNEVRLFLLFAKAPVQRMNF